MKYMRSSTLLGTVFLVAAAAAVPIAQAASPADGAPQQELQTRIAEERNSVIVGAVRKVAPSVASVVVSGTQRVSFFDDPFIRQFFGADRFGPSRERRYRMQSGSAVMISADGEFLTNAHVVDGADEISLLLQNGETRNALVVGTSGDLDLALLRTDPTGLTPADLGTSSDLLVGEWLIAVGYPVGGRGITTDSRFQPTVTVGVVSALERSFTPVDPRSRERHFYPDMIQTDADINPGNSGGPLANASGEVIGINTFILSDSGGSQGLGFAIPIDRALKAAAEFRAYGQVRPIDLTGLSVPPREMDERTAAQYGFDEPQGLIISTPGVAASAGLEAGDVLLQVDGEPVNSLQEARLALIPRFVGDRVALGVWRDGRRIDLVFVLREAEVSR